MQWIVITVSLTLVVSFLCSLCEAIIVNTTVADLESLKRRNQHRGERLEQLKHGDETIPAILALYTVANTFGSVLVGGLVMRHSAELTLGLVASVITLMSLFIAEVIPRHVGRAYRRALQPLIVMPLSAVTRTLRPITWLCNGVVRLFIPETKAEQTSDEDIILLAERGAQEGTLTRNESNLIANALSLDNVRVSEIMTPRTVVTALKRQATVAEVFSEYPNLPFGRMPVYGRNLDDIVGVVRRRDLLKAKANDQDAEVVERIMQEVQFIPETVTVSNALQVFVKTHQQFLVAVDEFGSMVGVLTMEDVIEHLLGTEIFEKDDVAVDMRELARSKSLKMARNRRGDPPTPTAPPIPPSRP